MSPGYRRVERFDPDYVQAMMRVGAPATCPFCLEPMSLHPVGPRTEQDCGEAIRRAAAGEDR